MKKLRFLLMPFILSIFITVPVISFAEAAKEITADPFKYVGVSTFSDLMYQINMCRDIKHNPLNAKSISFDINPTVTFFNHLGEEGSYQVSMPDKIDIELTDGYTAEIPFATGEIVHFDNEWKLATEEFKGNIVIEVISSGENKPRNIKFEAYFIGDVKARTRLGKVADGNNDNVYEANHTKSNPLRVSFNYRIPMTGQDTSDESWRNITMSMASLTMGAQNFKFIMKPKTMIVSEQPKKVSTVNVNTKAAETKGETGIPVPVAVVISILTAGAAIAAAGSNGGKDEENDEKKSSKYRMYIRKDFGDKIRYDTPPVLIYARMGEIKEDGTEVDRPDLTNNIEIFTQDNHMKVEDCKMVGNYMGALICAESTGGEKPEKGVISFRFIGEGGSFQNNVTFNLVEKPYIEFPERGKYLNMTLNMLLGDGKTYETIFIPKDFIEKPENITVKAADNAPFEVEYEKADNNGYIIHVKNLSQKLQSIIYQKQSSYINVTAENEKEKAESSIAVELYPEGLSIANVKVEDDIVQFAAFDNEETSEYGDVKPTHFNVELAVTEVDAKGKEIVVVVEPEKYQPAFEKMKGNDERTQKLCEKFKYEIEPVPSNLKKYAFSPKEAIVEEKEKPYLVKLPVSCTYGAKEYLLEMPVRLIGGGPGPMEGREQELAKMKRIIGNVGGISSGVAKILRENGKKMSAAELRLVNKQICQEAIAYYTKDAQEYNKIADSLERMEFWAEWIKWFGDQAFSYLLTIYAGNGEIILTPAKDMCVEFIAELTADWIDGQDISNIDIVERIEKLNAIQKIDGMIENLLMTIATGENINIKTAASCLAGWFIYKVAKNVQDNIEKTGNINIFDAILGAGKDLTAEAMKKAGMKQFDKLMKNPSVRGKFEKWFGDFARKHIQNNYELLYNERGLIEIKDIATRSEALNKLMEGLMGEGINWAFNQFSDEPDKNAGKQVESYERITITGDGMIKVVLITPNEKTGNGMVAEVNIIDSFKGIFSLFFKAVFGFMPFETETKNPPNDPQLYI
ncbi:MAG: hypothetical protein PHC69_10735 [Ruminiclostridium sp.]|nr:hypothetical protein [Ruminiclostridium sp.]